MLLPVLIQTHIPRVSFTTALRGNAIALLTLAEGSNTLACIPG
jgi:hypothetical protein